VFDGRVNRVAGNDVTVKGVFIPKGMTVVVPIFALHMDPEVWPDPTKFNPDRYRITKFCAYIRRKFIYLFYLLNLSVLVSVVFSSANQRSVKVACCVLTIGQYFHCNTREQATFAHQPSVLARRT